MLSTTLQLFAEKLSNLAKKSPNSPPNQLPILPQSPTPDQIIEIQSVEDEQHSIMNITSNHSSDIQILQQIQGFSSKKQGIMNGEAPMEFCKNEINAIDLNQDNPIDVNSQDSSSQSHSLGENSEEKRKDRVFMLNKDLTEKQKSALQKLKLKAFTNPFFQAVENHNRQINQDQYYASNFLVNLPNIQIRAPRYEINSHKFIPPVCIINNLLELSTLINSQELKIQIKRYSLKFKIPFNRIFITFGIEILMKMFHTQHDIDYDPTDKYVFQKLNEYLLPLFRIIIVRNWFVLRRIVRGFLRRFGAGRVFYDGWLENILKKRKSALEGIGVDVFGLLAGKHTLLKTSNYIDYGKFIKEEQPKNYHNKFVNYKNKFPDVEFDDQQNREKMHNPEQPRVVSKLKYYQRKLSFKEKDKQILRKQANVLTGPNDPTIITFTRDPMPLVFDISINKAPLPVDLSDILSSQKQISFDRYGNIRIKKLGNHMDLCDESSEQVMPLLKKLEREYEEEDKLLLDFRNQQKYYLTKKQRMQQKKQRKNQLVDISEDSQILKKTVSRLYEFIYSQQISVPQSSQKDRQVQINSELPEQINNEYSSLEVLGAYRNKMKNRNQINLDESVSLEAFGRHELESIQEIDSSVHEIVGKSKRKLQKISEVNEEEYGIEQIITQMDGLVKDFVKGDPNYKINDLYEYLRSILQKKRVPSDQHQQICSLWANMMNQ